MADETPCSGQGCTKPARMAIRTTRPDRGDMRVTLYMDDRTAPKTASRYCKECGKELAGDLVELLVAG